MKINDEKRREVAQRLREVETLEYDGDEWCDEGDVLNALGLYNDGDPSSCDPDKVAFLADLIDRPTCKIEGTYDDEYGIYDHLTCGHVAMRQWPEPTNCCPNCGAQVER